MFSNLEQLPWAVRIFYLMMYASAVLNVIMALQSRYKSHWRIQFGYTAVVLALFDIYIGMRLGGMLDRTDYVQAIVWLYPLIALSIIMVPCLFYWEDKFYKKALNEAVSKGLIELDDN